MASNAPLCVASRMSKRVSARPVCNLSWQLMAIAAHMQAAQAAVCPQRCLALPQLAHHSVTAEGSILVAAHQVDLHGRQLSAGAALRPQHTGHSCTGEDAGEGARLVRAAVLQHEVRQQKGRHWADGGSVDLGGLTWAGQDGCILAACA